LYVDDSILLGPNPDGLDSIIEEIRGMVFNLTIEGEISDFLGVKIEHKDDGTIHLTQPHLIDSILKELHLVRTPKISQQLQARSWADTQSHRTLIITSTIAVRSVSSTT
jgi:hypothetical protein